MTTALLLLCACTKTIADEIKEEEKTEAPGGNQSADDDYSYEEEDTNDGNSETDNEGNEETDEGNDDGNSDNNESNEEGNDEQEEKIYTVAEARAMEDGITITVRGYIVGTCHGSINNSNFEPPFENTAAILLSDIPYDPDVYITDFKDNLFPVCINDITDTRKSLNLKDNEYLWNRPVTLTGNRAHYMNRPGLKRTLPIYHEF